jgi:basic membrane lipoprotein Med (substrate-binding protein (PBP1-ABC) superfamily)
LVLLSTAGTTATTTKIEANSNNNNNNNNYDDSKFKIATSGISNWDVNILNRLLQQSNSKCKENASTIIDYLFSMHNEINPSVGYKTGQIIILSQLSESCNNQKPFSQMTSVGDLFQT